MAAVHLTAAQGNWAMLAVPVGVQACGTVWQLYQGHDTHDGLVLW